ncbi:PQQ-dependent sugar dehydrogenase [Intrasporangium sp. YIM S08009]|uniref:PQQ-dependent sugar dehydrogenase n=1 Tax=Intrasporangium zincisolvens TaxID=3080018 RepID=UPI002B058F63|nr:PQQ-dependent sugar dehydrogenase [Intrasporangium sp. YIM S08009]
MSPITRTPARARRALTGLAGLTVAALLCAGCSTAPEAGSPSTVPGADASAPTGPEPAATTPAATGAASPSTRVTRPPDQPAGPVTLLGGLDIAWSIAVLPDGTALVSERNTGVVHHVPRPGSGGASQEVGRLPIVRSGGEGGLLGLAVARDFAGDPVVFAYYSTESDNRVAAVPWQGGRLGDPEAVLTGIPRGTNHNGGRIAFGPDGFLYIGTGDAGDSSLSQNLGSLGGKILRVTREGDPAPGNPFGGSPIWSYGHRNVQGLAWDSRDRLWASEFGANTWDELNLVEAGGNYGWPQVEGRADREELVDPVAQWPTSEMSPSGITIGPDGAVYLAALRGQSVWRVPIGADGKAGTPTRHLEGTYGRVRDVRFVDGRVWLTTSNGDDDRLVSLPRSAVGAA